MKYTKEALIALALDALKGDTKTEALYAYDDGTFLNPEQFEELKKENESEAKSLVKVKNPAAGKTADTIDALKAQVEELQKENESLKKQNEPKAPKESKEPKAPKEPKEPKATETPKA